MTEPKTIIIDCDGVLTNGKVSYSENGLRSKEFHSRDITAIKRFQALGWKVIILTRSTWKGLNLFATKCGCECITGQKDKAYTVSGLVKDGIPFICICDDLDDLEMCKLASQVYLPADASVSLKKELDLLEIDYITFCNHPGGSGVMDVLYEFITPKC